MSRLKQFKLPDLGEGLTEGEILQWMVKPGDEVKLNQPIVEVETAKAAVEVPSPYAGVVHEIHHAAGETVDVGAPIITFDTDPGAGPLDPVAAASAVDEHPEIGDMVPKPPAVPSVPAPPAEGFVEPGLHAAPIGDESGPLGALIGEVGPSGRTATLVGYGPKSVTAKRRARSDSSHATPVTPPVRATPPPPPAPGGGTVSMPSFGPDREQRVPVKGVRKLTAENMVASAFTAPHVTEFITLDMTPTMELRTKLQGLPEFAGVKVTPLLLVAKALLLAVKRNPEVNATWDEAAQEIGRASCRERV